MLTLKRGYLGAATIGGTILAFGGAAGHGDGGPPLDSIEEWDTENELWTIQKDTVKIPRAAFGYISTPKCPSAATVAILSIVVLMLLSNFF